MLFLASSGVNWLLHSFAYTVWGMTNELGFLFPRFVTFIVNGRVTFLDPTARHIQWMVLRLAAPPLPMPCWYTALARSGTTNRIPIAWIHIVFLLQFTRIFVMMAVCSAPLFVMVAPRWRSFTLLTCGLNGLILPLSRSWRVQ